MIKIGYEDLSRHGYFSSGRPEGVQALTPGSSSILDLDLKKILSKVESRHGVAFPREVLAVDYGERGDLSIGFKHVEKPVGEPTDDGLAVFFYEEDGNRPVAVEIMDLDRILQGKPGPKSQIS